jgi:hypothetical protein
MTGWSALVWTTTVKYLQKGLTGRPHLPLSVRSNAYVPWALMRDAEHREQSQYAQGDGPLPENTDAIVLACRPHGELATKIVALAARLSETPRRGLRA